MSIFVPPVGASRREAVAAAQVFFNSWVGALPARKVWLVEQVKTRAGWSPDGSIESLDAVEGFVAQHLSTEVSGLPAPSWKTNRDFQLGFSDYGWALIDGLAAYIAGVLLPATNTTWLLDDDPRSGHDLQPVPSRPGVTPPWRLAHAAVARVMSKDPDPVVRSAVEYILEMQARFAAQEAAGIPTTWHLVVGIEAMDNDDDEWDAEVQIPDYAEREIGRKAYASLEDRIAALPGVLEALGEDREIFLVRLTPEAKSDLETVRADIQAVIDKFSRQTAVE